MKFTDDDIRIIKIGNDDVRKLTSNEFMRLQDLMEKGRKGGSYNKAVKKLNLSGGGLATKNYVNPVKIVDNRKNRG
tara:strand:+ start:38 stop:265 length:228 start_codon:yes stop_codon:yes gene_type:complete